MYIKITDGETTHFIHSEGDIQFCDVGCMEENSVRDSLTVDEPLVEYMYFVTSDEDDREEREKSGVLIRPEGLPLRTYVTNWDVYLLSQTGKTLEVIHRCQ